VNRQPRGTPFGEGSGPHAAGQAQVRVWTAQDPPDLLTEAFDASGVIRTLTHDSEHQQPPGHYMGRAEAGDLRASATENRALTGSA